MRTLFWTTLALGLCFTTPLHAQDGPPDPPVERQVIVMFETDAAALPDGATRAEIGQAELPGQVKGLLQRAGAQRMAKGFPDFRRSDTLRVLENGRTYRVPDYTNLFVVTLPPNANRDSVVARLNRLPEWVQYAEKNQRPAARISPENRSHTIRSHTQNGTDEVIPPNQDDFDKQWGLRNTSGPDIEATKAWTYTKGSSKVTIGIVDGGIDANHVDLSGKVSGYTGTTDHSTAVAGVAAAKGDNSAGKVAGVDWRAQIHSEPQSSDLVGTAQSIDDAVTAGARAINNSWGFDDRSTTLSQALRSAYEADVLPVHANPYKDGSAAQESSYPNNVGPWIVNVGAMNQSGSPWGNTGSRSFTDIAAPGVNIYTTTVLYGDYGYRTGTSVAAPFVVGTASLLLSAEPSLRTHDIEHLLERTAQSYGSGRDPEVGYGMIDANAAVKRVSDPYEVSHGSASFTKIYNDEKVDFPNGFTKENGTSYGAGTYICDIYKLSASASSPDFYYEEKPWFWLPVTEKGFSAANPNDGNRYLSKSVSKNLAEATTYFYNCSNTLGQNIGWVPFDPTVHERNGNYEYTVIGKPAPPPLDVSITSGPTELDEGEQGTWTADANRNGASYTWFANEGSGWYQIGTGSSVTWGKDYISSTITVDIKVEASEDGDTVSAQTSVIINNNDGGGGCNALGSNQICLAVDGNPFLLRDVQAEAQENSIASVRWRASGSVVPNEFVVQHRADSTAAWSQIGTVPGGDSSSVESSGTVTYRFRTDKLEIGTHQFRVGLPQDAGSAPRAVGNSDTGGFRRYTGPVTAEVKMDEAYRLSAYPNPVQQRTTVELAVKERQEVSVGLYDVLGRRVATLHSGPLPAQELRRFRLDVSATGLTSGTYFLRVTGEDFATTERITVVR